MFKVKFLEKAKEFLDSLDEKPRDKIFYNIWKSQISKEEELLKKLDDEIWEFKTLYNKSAYRLFAFWDETEKSMIIATHGIIKKTQKTPIKELDKAKQLRADYLKIKRDDNI
ncbi:MAG: type II toxin-antitoxin system RelE/ParE family toxin [Saprospiraceae bacterium]|nr:type II toxin-antitoxin system RelE/ParE family toxin [Saprospiraceae bacterium]